MKHRNEHNPDRPASPDSETGYPRHRGHDKVHRGGHRRHGRPFDYGELRLLILALIADQPRHGYELIKAIEERLGGSYSPSPGVIYPILSWLDDVGYATVEPAPSGRKTYRITAEGEAFLEENRPAVDDLLNRTGTPGRGEIPAPILRGMENLKLALRLRLRSGPVGGATADKIAAALDAAAQDVERS
ncbi:PadR family transcriptional regulator (plasmid) [Agrobacterium tumefaciens]|uniref:PadR family transcriptional regulator n=1 Tax=Agrobacterium tumefaciens TaxID=358 RepID=UPI0021CDED1A|nr:PadR family transcriptional regulator [Agrobacterium tumefaciens]NTZ63473.1 PadR family transcriptional regulator [Agrobacterium tumefaciens]UXT00191.1 PadR family transcriptional regulator [Agrobacterium tumefaciens]UXT52891.1 PadR family transcriptional regulator [Agrobacterium tumefaciens]UXT68952.1 PadR family transcriptional regulator [Agrobacterium tumefaciens]